MQLAKLDIVTSVTAALFGAYVIVEAILYGVTSDTGPGAGTFPLVAGILILVFAIANLARTLRGAMPDALRLEGSIQLPEVARVLGTIVLIGVYIACFDKLGAFLPLPFLMVGVSLMIHWRADLRWLATLILSSVLFTTVCYFVFARFLGLLLPSGPLGL